jgi:4'-phosphopantetheinyl transferase
VVGQRRVLDTWVAGREELEEWADRHPVLDPTERRRAEVGGERGRDARAGATLLRLAVAARTGQSPAEVDVRRRCATCAHTGHGRPRLSHGLAASTSHSGGLVAVAVADSSWVGIDIEQVRPVPVADLARVAFDARERDLVGEDTEAFLDVWAVKEALSKASGSGILDGRLRQCAVRSVRPLRLHDLSGFGCASGRVLRLPLPDGYTGFVAAGPGVDWHHTAGLSSARTTRLVSPGSR